MLRYLGEVGSETPLVSTIAMCAGYCGKTGFQVLRKNKLYSRVLAKKWIDVLKQNAHVYEGTHVDLDAISKARSLEELDSLFSLKLLDFQDVEYVLVLRVLCHVTRNSLLTHFIHSFTPQGLLQPAFKSSFLGENRCSYHVVECFG